MKKIILFVSIIAFIAVKTNAQGFRFGAKLGANLSKISGKSFNEAFNLGYHAGLFAEIDFTKTWGIQPELLLNQSSTRTTDFNGNLLPDITTRLNYLSIPILVRYNFAKIFTLNAGPQFGIAIDKNKSLLQNGGDAFKNGDFAMLAGLQINLKKFRVYGRYNIGLSNLNDIDNSEKWRSQQLQLGVGLKF